MISEQTKEYFELGKRNDVREHSAVVCPFRGNCLVA